MGITYSSSMEVAKIATQMAISTREEEEQLKKLYKNQINHINTVFISHLVRVYKEPTTYLLLINKH